MTPELLRSFFYKCGKKGTWTNTFRRDGLVYPQWVTHILLTRKREVQLIFTKYIKTNDCVAYVEAKSVLSYREKSNISLKEIQTKPLH